MWRRDTQTGQAFALKLTAAGVKAIAAEDRSDSNSARDDSGDRVSVATASSEVIRQKTSEVPMTGPARPSAPRDETKLARVLELLQRDCGATLEGLIEATDWLPHTTRAALTGLRKRGYAVTIDRSDKGRGSTYRARSNETIDLEQVGSQNDDPPRISAPRKLKTTQRSEEPQAQQAA